MLIIFLFNIEGSEVQKFSNFPKITDLVNQENQNLKDVISYTKSLALNCYTMMPCYDSPL